MILKRNTCFAVFFVICSIGSVAAQKGKSIVVNFYIKEKLIPNASYYIFNNSNRQGIRLKVEDGHIILPDTLTTPTIAIVLAYKEHRTIFPIYNFAEVDKLEVFYDNRIFGNPTKKKLGIGRFDGLLHKRYYWLSSDSGDFYVTYTPEHPYKLIEPND